MARRHKEGGKAQQQKCTQQQHLLVHERSCPRRRCRGTRPCPSWAPRLGFDDGGERVAREDGLRRALKVIGRHLLTQLRHHRVDLPALVVGQVRGGDAPAGSRVAELAHDNGTSDSVHLDEPLPHVAPIQQGDDMVLGQDGDAEGVLLEADVLREPARL